MKAGQPNNRDDGLLSNLRYRRKWKKVTSVLSIFVAVGTISSLMLPAITLNKDACGKEAHTHAAECYSVTTEQVLNCNYDTLGIHRHSSDCQDEDGNTRCSQVDFVVHTHDSTCYQSDGSLSCFLKEIEDHRHEDSCYQATEVVVDPGHSHGDGCYEWVKSETPTCETQESSGHQHGDGCYATGTELLCTETERPEHSHSDICYERIDTLICTQEEVPESGHSDECFDENGILLCSHEESSGHTHGTDCFAQTSQLVCLTEEASGHTHSSECYAASGSLLCTEEETPSHQHSEECYGLVKGDLICSEEEREPVIETGEPELICKEPEVLLHTHKGTCYEYDDQGNPVSLVCGMPEVTEHQHTDTCFAEKEVHTLVCEIPEHTHTEACSGSSELTEEEQAQVDGLILAIDSLPSPEEVTAQLAAFDEAGDTAGRDAYTAALLEQISPVFGQYGALTEKQKSAVTNAAALMALEWLLPEEEPVPSLPVEQTTAPTEESSSPTEETVLPTENTTPPTEETVQTTEPSEEELLLAQSAVDVIAALPDFDFLGLQWSSLEEAGELDQWITELDQLHTLLLEARTIYEKVPLIAQSNVSNLDKLVILESLLEAQRQCLEQIMQQEVDQVIAIIDALPDQETIFQLLMKSDMTQDELAFLKQTAQDIIAAYDGWNALRSQQKPKVSNFMQLESLLPLLARIQVPEDHPAVIFTDESLTELYLTSIAITVTGQLPEGTQVKAFPVEVQIPGGKSLYAFDICIASEDGTEYQPEDTVTVRISGLTLESDKKLRLYHIPAEGEPEELLYTLDDGNVRFDVSHFSVYALADVTYQSLPEVELPTVGGPGILPCVLGGLSLMCGSLLSVYKKKKQQRGNRRNNHDFSTISNT